MVERGTKYDVADLLRVMQRLRDPDTGCPWDLKQDFRSIVPSTLEECYELADAIEQGDLSHVAEELGDVLFQVMFYCQLAAEQGAFDFEQVVDTLVGKLIRRHPHVFAEGEIEGVVAADTSVESVKASWEAIKRAERAAKQHTGVLADIPLALPALPRAQKVQKRAAGIGFDWTETAAVLANLESEIAELREAMRHSNADDIADEAGDVLFSAVNLVRHLKLDAESTLRHATQKFEQRFNAMEADALAEGADLGSETPAALESRWIKAKSTKANL